MYKLYLAQSDNRGWAIFVRLDEGPDLLFCSTFPPEFVPFAKIEEVRETDISVAQRIKNILKDCGMKSIQDFINSERVRSKLN